MQMLYYGRSQLLRMLLWSHWWLIVSQLRPACSRQRTFLWLAVTLAAMAVRRDLGGVTSFVRALGPALGGGLWGFASTSLRPPLGQFLPFFLVSLGLVASSLVYTKVLPPPGELAAAREKEAEEERAAYQLVSSAASAAEEATGKGSGEERAFSSSSSRPPVLSGEDDDGDAAADGTVKVVVVAPPPSISSS